MEQIKEIEKNKIEEIIFDNLNKLKEKNKEINFNIEYHEVANRFIINISKNDKKQTLFSIRLSDYGFPLRIDNFGQLDIFLIAMDLQDLIKKLKSIINLKELEFKIKSL